MTCLSREEWCLFLNHRKAGDYVENGTTLVTGTGAWVYPDACPRDYSSTLMFVTFFIGLIDMKTGQLDFCNCGHCAPVIGDGEGHASFIKMLPNLPIGIFPKYKFKGEKIDNIKGKYLFIYTDGLDEAENLKQELFGKNRLLEVFRSKTSDKANQAIETMTAEVEKHRNGAEPNDDLTMMCINIKNHNEYDYQD